MPKWKFLFIAVALLLGNQSHGSFADFEKEFSEQPEKLVSWNEMASEVDRWRDGLGKPIDSGIKETVIILNLLDLKTRQSCEGHTDWGCPFPWVDFDLVDAESLKEVSDKIAEYSEKVKPFADLKKFSLEEWEERESLYAKLWEYRNLRDKIRQEAYLPIHGLLENFYRTRSASYENEIFLEPLYGRIFSFGGQWEHVRSDLEKEQKLQEYREEMQTFTDFLIEEFLKYTESGKVGSN